ELDERIVVERVGPPLLDLEQRGRELDARCSVVPRGARACERISRLSLAAGDRVELGHTATLDRPTDTHVRIVRKPLARSCERPPCERARRGPARGESLLGDENGISGRSRGALESALDSGSDELARALEHLEPRSVVEDLDPPVRPRSLHPATHGGARTLDRPRTRERRRVDPDPHLPPPRLARPRDRF